MAAPAFRQRKTILRKDGRKRRNPKNEVKFDILPEPDDKDRFFVIERLLDKRKSEEGFEEYLVRWQNYPPSYDSWEPRAELELNAADMVSAYERKPGSSHSKARKRQCICKRPYRFEQGGMIQCYKCSVWYHFSCISMNMEQANSYARYYCLECRSCNPELKNAFKTNRLKTFFSIPEEGF